MDDESREGHSPPRPTPNIPDHHLFSCIGRGSYGEVWLAKNIVGTYRAVKIVSRSIFENDRPYEREFTGMRKFEPISREHSGLLDILQLGRNDAAGYFYYVMELADDANTLNQSPKGNRPTSEVRTLDPKTYSPKTLRRVVQQRDRLPFSECLNLALSLTEALEHLHRHGLIHRDIKPSNIIFVEGTPKLADIGLVTELGEPMSFVGTAGFIPPEGPGSVQADIYSLGKVLYEIATGKDRHEFPEPVTDLAEAPERDKLQELNEVILRACERDPRKRYASASVMHADLELLQSGKSLKRLRILERRVKLFAYLSLAATALVVAGYTMQQVRLARAQEKGQAAQFREQERRRQLLIQEAKTACLVQHATGWSEEAWKKVREAASVRIDYEVRNTAVATLAGLDARALKEFDEFGGSSVSFDTSGKRLLIGGLADGAKLWDSTTDELQVSPIPGSGPVAFTPEGAPLLLLWTAASRLVLHKFEDRNPLAEFIFTMNPDTKDSTFQRRNAMAMTPDGARIAAVTSFSQGNEKCAVWDTRSGKLLHEFGMKANTLALSSDGEFLAGGDNEGNINIWRIEDGENIARFKERRIAIQSLAFQRDPLRTGMGKARHNWLLAAGHSGGAVTVWDLRTGIPKNHLRGSWHDVFALGFSPDGTILAWGGRSFIQISDVATGELLLEMNAADFISGLCFSADGTKLASCNNDSGPKLKRTYVWELEFGRGVRTLRGLQSKIARVCFSPQNKLIAALDNNWQLAIWDVETGSLRHVLDTPQGFTAHNAALAFSPDSSQFSLCTGSEAKLWDTASGNELRSWSLPPGLVDRFAFPNPDELLLFRVETNVGNIGPFGNPPLGENQRVCRLRNLFNADALLWELDVFPLRVFDAACPADGRYFLIEGLGETNGRPQRMIKAIARANGSELWSKDITKKNNYAINLIDATGQFAVIDLHEVGGESTLIEASSGKILKTLEGNVRALGPRGQFWLLGFASGKMDRDYTLWDSRQGSTLMRLDIHTASHLRSNYPQFDDLDGNFLAWGNADGTVSICNIQQTRERLRKLNLGWE